MQQLQQYAERRITHSDLYCAVKNALQKSGWYVINHQSYRSALVTCKGMADMQAIKNGMSVWLEIKVGHDIQREDQKKFQQAIEEHGGKYMIVRDIEDIIPMLEGYINWN